MSIENLRNQIDHIDERIIRLIAERLRTADLIGREKQKTRSKIEDKDREARVLNNIRKLAEQEKLLPEDVEKIYRQIIEASKNLQIRNSTDNLKGKNFAIIGGTGKMGSWIASYLKAEGANVTISGRDLSKIRELSSSIGVNATNVENAINTSKYIVLAVPIDNFEQIAKQVSPLLHSQQIIIELSSIKKYIREIAKLHFKNNTLLSIHPMFGPGASTISGHKIILTPESADERALAQRAADYLNLKGAIPVILSVAEHDRLMSYALALAHFIGIVTADTMNALDVKQIRKVAGTTCQALLNISEAVISEDPDFYCTLQMRLPETVKAESEFIKISQRWFEMVVNKDRAGFVSEMKKLNKNLKENDPHFPESYGQMYRLLK